MRMHHDRPYRGQRLELMGLQVDDLLHRAGQQQRSVWPKPTRSKNLP